MATCVVPEYYPLRRWISRSIPRESPLPVDSLKRIRIRQTLAQLSPGFVATINANLLSWLFMSEGETSSSFATTWVGWGGFVEVSYLYIFLPFSSLSSSTSSSSSPAGILFSLIFDETSGKKNFKSTLKRPITGTLFLTYIRRCTHRVGTEV